MALAEILSTLIIVSAVLILLLLITEERDPSTTLAWALVLILLPGLGVALYLLIGRNWRRIARSDRVRALAHKRGEEGMRSIYERWQSEAQAAIATKPPFIRAVSNSITRQNDNRPLPAYGLTVYDTGAAKFAALMEDIAAAQESIHLEYFIWQRDELTERICRLLARRAAEGVEVRVMYDWVGGISYRKDQLKWITDAGGTVKADSAHWTKLNYRNHRKVAIFDGRIAYTGGMNVGQEYIDGLPRYKSWRDTHARVEGPLVADLQRTFAERWYRVAHEDLFGPKYLRPLELDGHEPIWSQVVTSGPESEFQAIRNVFMLAIMAARSRVRIQSPYFVPDEPIEQSLIATSLAGVDLRFMMTGVPDKKIAWNAAFSYIDELIAAGGRLFHYEAGFFHVKTMTIDGELAVLGTTNFDIRSFMLHDELSVCFFDREVAARLDASFDADMDQCIEIDERLLSATTRLGGFRNAIARLWSRLL